MGKLQLPLLHPPLRQRPQALGARNSPQSVARHDRSLRRTLLEEARTREWPGPPNSIRMRVMHSTRSRRKFDGGVLPGWFPLRLLTCCCQRHRPSLAASLADLPPLGGGEGRTWRRNRCIQICVEKECLSCATMEQTVWIRLSGTANLDASTELLNLAPH